MLAILLAAVTLTAPFGQAVVTVSPGPGDGMTVRIVVDVETGVTAVIARVVFADGIESVVALAPEAGGSWSGSLATPRRENARVAFEAIGPDGSPTPLPPWTRTALGADAAVVSPQASLAAPPDDARRFPWGWVGLVTGVASAGLLAAWAVAGRRGRAADGAVPREEAPT